ncbi:hypothetical protein AB0N38_26005 [Micromonospora aurantiaca]|uniref:Uncharacterized protein n=4 Tax=Micromonospora TaxID=1873 RepID=A0AAW4JG20_9ACTN|nr:MULTISPECIES: hypothetical protein [Micromonospora]ADU10954.1 hypothetical protein ML5_5493 [Micromonospora sp. L5]AXH92422.1 hypothetical protein DVH21_22240 [Micromonospora aurantiaca]KAB1108470.1 hypothetical protein F6X54_22385 [Micromonospora aurantiaca]KAB1908343.1 hypothetical protein F8279_07680 [Micromonospora sp. AMSO1212t]MBC9004491.1 hypothetical protein [Micromonospora aurantiaca]
MTDLYPAADQRELLRQAATAHTTASAEVEAFLRRLPEVPGPADVTEYANLLSREERARADRQAAADAAGLRLPSLESE